MPPFSYRGSEVCFEVFGFGPPLLLIHGWELGNPPPGGESLDELRQELAKHFRVVSPDLAGFGKSAPPPTVWGVEDYAKSLLALMERVGTSRFVLCGYSFGGQVAIKLAALAQEPRSSDITSERAGRAATRLPDRITHLILIAGSGIRRTPALRARVFLWGTRFTKLILKLPFVPQDVRDLILWYARRRFRLDYLSVKGIMRDVFRRVIREDLRPVMPSVKLPVLLLWGERDSLVPLKNGKEMARLFPNAKLVTFPDIGHQLPKLQAEKVVEEIVRFVKR